MVYSAAFRVGATGGTGTGTSSAPSPNIPSGCHVGDLVQVWMLTNGGTPVWTPPAGWSQKGPQANSSNGCSVTLFEKIAVAADINSNPVFALGTGGRVEWFVRCYQDVDLTTPDDVTMVSGSGAAALSLVAPSQSPAGGRTTDMSVVGYAFSAAIPPITPVWTPPGSYGRAQSGATAGTTGAGNVYGAAYDRHLASASATGTVTAGIDSSHSWAAMHVLLRQKTVNTTPTVNAGSNQTVVGNDLVTLSMTASDADGDTLTLSWSQDLSVGQTVDLTDNGDGTASFVAPNITGTLRFTASASDGTAGATDQLDVTVSPQAAFIATLRASAVADWTVATDSPTFPVPSPTQVGDVCYALVVTNGIQAVSTYPAGWTLVPGSEIANSSNGCTLRILEHHVISAADAGATISGLHFASSGRHYIEVLDFFDIDPTTSVDATVVPKLGTSAAPSTNGVTASRNGVLLVAVYATSLAAPAANLAWTTPATYGNALLGNTNAASGAGNVYIATFQHLQSTSGAVTGPATTIGQSRQWIGVLLALRPKTGNTAPVADAGADISGVMPYAQVSRVLLASDVDGDDLTITSVQTSGSPTVTIDGDDTLDFVAPATQSGTTLVFTETADDGQATDTDAISVTVLPHNTWVMVGGVLVPVHKHVMQ